MVSLPDLNAVKIAVIGLGYVGLPLAVEFGKLFPVLGFDLDEERVSCLNAGNDFTYEVTSQDLCDSSHLTVSSDKSLLSDCNVFIVTVPTPIDDQKMPNLKPLIKASELVGRNLKLGDIIIYESTVYPGATEEDCVPVLEELSGMKFNQDFFVGYSPERINPGDQEHRLTSIIKVTAGSTVEASIFVHSLYTKIIKAGVHRAPSIKVAEAAKVIENTQRDLNIALVNELAIIFNKMGIETSDVLDAAETKWNFLPFRPGLVGGHCIGVDPYYLTYKAKSMGYRPEIVLSGRRLNDAMGSYVASQLIKTMIKEKIHVNGSKVLIMGLTFKENCPDIRNTRVIDVISELAEFGVSIDVYDPWADRSQAMQEHNVSIVAEPEYSSYDAIVLTVAHSKFKDMGSGHIRSFGKKKHVFYDIKNLFEPHESDLRL